MSIVHVRQTLSEIFKPWRVSNVSHAYREGGRKEVVRFTLAGEGPATEHELVIEGAPLMTRLAEAALELRTQLQGEPE